MIFKDKENPVSDQMKKIKVSLITALKKSFLLLIKKAITVCILFVIDTTQLN